MKRRNKGERRRRMRLRAARLRRETKGRSKSCQDVPEEARAGGRLAEPARRAGVGVGAEDARTFAEPSGRERAGGGERAQLAVGPPVLRDAHTCVGDLEGKRLGGAHDVDRGDLELNVRLRAGRDGLEGLGDDAGDVHDRLLRDGRGVLDHALADGLVVDEQHGLGRGIVLAEHQEGRLALATRGLQTSADCDLHEAEGRRATDRWAASRARTRRSARGGWPATGSRGATQVILGRPRASGVRRAGRADHRGSQSHGRRDERRAPDDGSSMTMHTGGRKGASRGGHADLGGHGPAESGARDVAEAPSPHARPCR